MKRVLLVLSVIALIVVVVGFSMGWFQVSSSNQDNKRNISLSVDTDKIESDKDKVVDAVQDLGQQAKDKVAETTPKTEDKPTSSEQPPTDQE